MLGKKGVSRGKEEVVKLIQEDPWTGDWVEFKVPHEYAEREWR